ncbi:peroxiredoxin Q/BCP [Pararhizobium capsulatum DSM 1112]|uniref:thioredoxin-dependent peroxiredoxin n=1 Tax=Pararhizobium capsulatum DSM 1112 TaxID=1121113 RepID=A0ABU0BS16_9HYPH|nr:peroxiredoxin [Pararhizobium capsulatum]MDQ0320451.1 peroxiredoxin Q/BCP [Pararhizobium capsulatum DSM 1112]
MAKVAAGDAAPDFELLRDGGGTISLASYRLGWLVLFFYPKDDTSSCTTEAINFSSKAEEFAAAGVSLLGISPDPVKKHDKFIKKYDLKTPLVSDETKAVCEAYGVWVEKTLYGRRYMGVERTTLLIDPEGVVRRVWEKVKVTGHVEDVLATAKMQAEHGST